MPGIDATHPPIFTFTYARHRRRRFTWINVRLFAYKKVNIIVVNVVSPQHHHRGLCFGIDIVVAPVSIPVWHRLPCHSAPHTTHMQLNDSPVSTYYGAVGMWRTTATNSPIPPNPKHIPSAHHMHICTLHIQKCMAVCDSHVLCVWMNLIKIFGFDYAKMCSHKCSWECILSSHPSVCRFRFNNNDHQHPTSTTTTTIRSRHTKQICATHFSSLFSAHTKRIIAGIRQRGGYYVWAIYWLAVQCYMGYTSLYIVYINLCVFGCLCTHNVTHISLAVETYFEWIINSIWKFSTVVRMQCLSKIYCFAYASLTILQSPSL